MSGNGNTIITGGVRIDGRQNGGAVTNGNSYRGSYSGTTRVDGTFDSNSSSEPVTPTRRFTPPILPLIKVETRNPTLTAFVGNPEGSIMNIQLVEENARIFLFDVKPENLPVKITYSKLDNERVMVHSLQPKGLQPFEIETEIVKIFTDNKIVKLDFSTTINVSTPSVSPTSISKVKIRNLEEGENIPKAIPLIPVTPTDIKIIISEPAKSKK